MNDGAVVVDSATIGLTGTGQALAPDIPPQGKARRQRGRYVSASILDRRRRTLEAAQAMICEGNPGMLTLRELGRRAGVSVTTIYATYGDKETLIAAAIQDFYNRLPMARAPRPATLAGLLAFTAAVRDGILENKTYARGFATLYFSSTLDPKVHGAIVEIVLATLGVTPWLRVTIDEGGIIPPLEKTAVALIVNMQMVVLRDWAQGRVSDDDLGSAIKIGFLLSARGITHGRAHAEAGEELDRVLGGGSFKPDHAESWDVQNL